MATQVITRTFLQNCEIDNKLSTQGVGSSDSNIKTKKDYRTLWGYFEAELKFTNIILFAVMHGLFLYGLTEYRWIGRQKEQLYCYVISFFGGFGILAGAHRYFTHRSYKATRPMQIFLLACYTISGHNKLFNWVQDHRVHHKYSETNADPHNSNRGFFFAHMGWLMMKKHPDVIAKGKTIDMSDFTNDSLLMWHNKYYVPLSLIFAFFLPTWGLVYFFNETWYWAFMQYCIGRYLIFLHMSWSVNSAAHLFGSKTYNATINARENRVVAFLSMGEGWHNYHHVFPWDFRASEYGKWNPVAFWLLSLGKLGLCYDFKTASPELVERVSKKLGDKAEVLKLSGIPQNVDDVDEWIKEKSW